MQRRKEPSWRKLQTGDTALFVGNWRVYARATVTVKVHNPALAQALWGSDENGPWEYMYFLDEVARLDIPQAALNEAAEYADNAVIRQFVVLDEEKSDRILAAFGVGSDQHPGAVTDQEYRDAVEHPFDPEQPLDKATRALARKEQAYLRRALFGSGRTGICFVCGYEMPTRLLVAAHIKKRSQATAEERLDASNIVVAMCSLGCDELYEKGFLSVEDGQIICEIGPNPTHQLAERLDALSGRAVSVADGMVEYFAWHHEYMFMGRSQTTSSLPPSDA